MDTQKHDAFYIGWQPEAPGAFANQVRMAVIILIFAVPLVAGIVVLSQRGFADSVFEYGQPTEVKGTMLTAPAPFIRVMHGVDVVGKPVYQHILLVAPGKHGAGEMLMAREAQLGHALHGKTVTLTGFLIYHDGRTLMEVETLDDIREIPGEDALLTTLQPYGGGALIGEITDPKCLFGVMKPAQGKPHRSCAARCIAGGIPPVLKTISAQGRTSYYLIADAHGNPVNQEVLPFIGDQVAICGEIRRLGEWNILYRDAQKGISRIAENAQGADVRCW